MYDEPAGKSLNNSLQNVSELQRDRRAASNAGCRAFLLGTPGPKLPADVRPVSARPVIVPR